MHIFDSLNSMATIGEITAYLETIAPLSLQENYDNAGLIIGNPETAVKNILVCLDSTPEVLEEAKAKNCNLVIAHHPIVFSGLKKINGKNYIEKTVISAIRSNIAIYAIHTNLDNVLQNGVNQKIAQKLELNNIRVLAPKKEHLHKLVVFCPTSRSEQVRNAMFAAGAGNIGNYSGCSFYTEGKGTFRAGEGSNPYVGKEGERHVEPEERIETIVPRPLLNKVIQAMTAVHPYEEVAYDVYTLDNVHSQTGPGAIGELKEAMSTDAFLAHVKTSMNVPLIRYTSFRGDSIKKVALCGGSGSFLLEQAKAAGADVFLTSDVKYHRFFDGEGKIMIADVGHYEGEYFTIALIHEILTKKFDNFAVIFSGTNTNPIKYYH